MCSRKITSLQKITFFRYANTERIYRYRKLKLIRREDQNISQYQFRCLSKFSCNPFHGTRIYFSLLPSLDLT